MSQGNGFVGLQENNNEAYQRAQQVPQLSIHVDEGARRQERADKVKREAMEHISPVESPPCRMPRLLNERRERYLIIDQMFQYPAMYDRILVRQVSLHHGSDTAGGRIVLTEKSKDAARDAACLGVVVSAGLKALDELRSNGCDLGHLVAYVQWSVYRIPVANIMGTEYHLLVLKAGDIVADCDLQRLLNENKVRTVEREFKDSEGNITRQHVFIDEGGKLWQPQEPFTSEI